MRFLGRWGRGLAEAVGIALVWVLGCSLVASIAFTVVGPMVGWNKPFANLALDGARNGALYGGIWAGGLVIVLTVMRAYQLAEGERTAEGGPTPKAATATETAPPSSSVS